MLTRDMLKIESDLLRALADLHACVEDLEAERDHYRRAFHRVKAERDDQQRQIDRWIGRYKKQCARVAELRSLAHKLNK